MHSGMLALRPLKSAKRITLVSNGEMDNIMKIVKSLEDSSLLVEGVNKTIKNEATKQKR